MRTHRPFVWLMCAMLSGIFSASLWPVPVWGMAIVFGIGVIALLLRWRWIYQLGLVLVAFSFGAISYLQQATLASDDISRSKYRFYGEEILLKGRVVSDIRKGGKKGRTRISFTLEAQQITRKRMTRASSGKVMVTMFEDKKLRYGDVLQIRGKLHRPFDLISRGRLSYRSYLARQGTFVMLTVRKGALCQILERGKGSWFITISLELRQQANSLYDHYLPLGASGLLKALLTGERGDVPDHIREIFQRTGTAHILAISGLNISLVAFGLFLLLNILPVGRKAQMGLVVGFIAFYSALTGGNAPVVRSAIMSIVFLLSFMIEREQDSINTLSLAAFLILLADPSQAFNVGFQLSFVCVASIILITPILMGLVNFDLLRSCPRWLELIMQAFWVSAAAFLGSLGLVSYYFGMVTPIALLANLPIIPLVGIVTALGGGLLIFSFIPAVAGLFAVCAKVGLSVLVWELYAFTLVPGGSWMVMIPFSVMIGYYAVLVLVLGGFYWRRRFKSQGTDVWAIGWS